MNKYSALLFAALVPASLLAQDLPKPSPPGRVEQQVGLTKIVVEYSRPSARGRVVFGDLVPYDQLWRTGANQNTTVEFDKPVKFAGNPVPAGKYSLYAEPGMSEWKIYLNKRTDMWGTEEFSMDDVVAKAKAPIGKNAAKVETFTIYFDDLVNDKATIHLAWEFVNVAVEIDADATAEALENIREAVKDPKADYRVFHSCARFCLDRNLQLKDALGWAEKSVKLQEKYWNTYTYALLLAANDKKTEAIATAQHGMTLAQEANAPDYSRMFQARLSEWGQPQR